MAKLKQTRPETFRKDLSAEYVRSILDYCPITGLFRWKPHLPWKRNAGTKVTTGHLTIKIDGKWYNTGRLAWLYMTGEWPVCLIDHKNRIPDDNRFENLRQATRSDNSCNRPGYKPGKKLKGAFFDKDTKKWRAIIMRHRTTYNIGRFKTEEEAHEAYKKAAKEFHGEFALVK